MDPLFVNATHMNYDLFLDAMRMHHRYRHRKARVLMLCYAVVCIVMLAASIRTRSYALSILFVAVGAFAVFYFIAGYRLQARHVYRNFQALHPTGEIAYALFEDNLHIESGNGCSSYGYERFTHIIIGSEAIVLLIANNFLVMDRSGFDGSRADAAIRYLRDRCVQTRFYPERS